MPKLIILGVIGYAVSPIDLIPDFIPVLGYLDDLILLPMGIWLAIRLVPSCVWEEYRSRYQNGYFREIPRSKWAAVVIIAVWYTLLLICALCLKYFLKK